MKTLQDWIDASPNRSTNNTLIKSIGLRDGKPVYFSYGWNLKPVDPQEVDCFTLTTGEVITAEQAHGLLNAIVEIPHVPNTRNQKAQAYLDWTNNFLTLKGFADHYGLSLEAAENLIEEGRNIHELNVKIFTVVSVSSNANSFGYKGVLVLAEDGTGYELGFQAYGTEAVPDRGDTIQGASLPSYPPPRKLPDTLNAKTILGEIEK